VPAAQLAPAFELPKGKPVYLTLHEGDTNDAGLQLLENQLSKEVNFMKLDASSDEGKEAAEAFGIEKLPAAVVADSNGNVLAKVEGALTTREMDRALKDLVK